MDQAPPIQPVLDQGSLEWSCQRAYRSCKGQSITLISHGDRPDERITNLRPRGTCRSNPRRTHIRPRVVGEPTGTSEGAVARAGQASPTELYKEFIEAASKCNIHALQHDEPDIPAVVELYVKIGRMESCPRQRSSKVLSWPHEGSSMRIWYRTRSSLSFGR